MKKKIDVRKLTTKTKPRMADSLARRARRVVSRMRATKARKTLKSSRKVDFLKS